MDIGELTQIKLLNWDRFGAICAVLIGLRHFQNKHIKQYLPFLMIGITSDILPEILSGLYSSKNHHSIIPKSIKYFINPTNYQINTTFEQIFYVIFHCAWHLCMFHISNLVSMNAH